MAVTGNEIITASLLKAALDAFASSSAAGGGRPRQGPLLEP